MKRPFFSQYFGFVTRKRFIKLYYSIRADTIHRNLSIFFKDMYVWGCGTMSDGAADWIDWLFDWWNGIKRKNVILPWLINSDLKTHLPFSHLLFNGPRSLDAATCQPHDISCLLAASMRICFELGLPYSFIRFLWLFEYFVALWNLKDRSFWKSLLVYFSWVICKYCEIFCGIYEWTVVFMSEL